MTSEEPEGKLSSNPVRLTHKINNLVVRSLLGSCLVIK